MNTNIEQNDVQNNIDKINKLNQKIFNQQIDIKQNIDIDENNKNNRIHNEEKNDNKNL